MRVSLWKQRWEGECPVGRRPGNAFTLVELLVVVAIISLLASLLAPALQSAVAKAKIIKCLGNQKQIAMGLDMYAADYRQWYPYAWGWKPEILPYKLWHRTLLMGGYLGREYNDESETYDIAKRGETVLICPEDATPNPQSKNAPTDFLSYGMNASIASYNGDTFPHYIRKNRLIEGAPCGKPDCKTGWIIRKGPRDIYLTVDCRRGASLWWGSDNFDHWNTENDGQNAVGTIYPFHGTGAPMSFVDGHARFVPYPFLRNCLNFENATRLP